VAVPPASDAWGDDAFASIAAPATSGVEDEWGAAPAPAPAPAAAPAPAPAAAAAFDDAFGDFDAQFGSPQAPAPQPASDDAWNF
jgi:pyruvate dehydrogenase E2 component (dihydrolipoamide acetyltransferase)